MNRFRAIEKVSRIARLAVFSAFVLVRAPATADVTTVDGANSPIVRVNVAVGHVFVRTWDRPAVQVDGGPSVTVERRHVREVGGDRSILIPQATLVPDNGFQLPPEGFVVSTIPAGPRDVIAIRTTGPSDSGDLTVTIPSGTVFLFVHNRDGSVEIREYRGGTLVAFTGRGALRIFDGGGTIFAQTGRGPIVMTNVNADRIRSRSLVGNTTFERCAVRQIEATSIAGSIVYDAGTFSPGLAHFESTSGDVAIGSTSAVDLGGRSLTGRVYTDVAPEANVSQSAGTTNVGIGGGGPLVNAASGRGNVYLYSGSLLDQHERGAPWVAPMATLSRPGEARQTIATPQQTIQQRPQQRMRAQPSPRFRSLGRPSSNRFPAPYP